MRTKRGYLASVLLAGVMIAGYLGMLPLLQSLAAEPAWPDAPAAVSNVVAAPLVVPYAAAPVKQGEPALASSKPVKDKKKAKKNNAKAAKRTPQRAGSPARATGGSTGSTTNANRGGSGSSGAQNVGGSSSTDGGSAAGAPGSGGSCVGCTP